MHCTCTASRATGLFAFRILRLSSVARSIEETGLPSHLCWYRRQEHEQGRWRVADECPKHWHCWNFVITRSGAEQAEPYLLAPTGHCSPGALTAKRLLLSPATALSFNLHLLIQALQRQRPSYTYIFNRHHRQHGEYTPAHRAGHLVC